MKVLRQSILLFLAIFATLVAHIFAVSFLPFPFNRLNVVMLALVWWCINSSEERALGKAVGLSFLMELFSSAPFGMQLVALAGTVMILGRLLRTVFTNHSWYIILLAGVTSLLMYRLFLTILLFAHGWWRGVPWQWNKALVASYGLELAVTTLTIVIGYGVFLFIRRRWRPLYVSSA